MSLHAWSLDDVADAFAIWGDPEVMRYVGPHHEDQQRTHDALEAAMDAQSRHGCCLWRLASSGRCIGVCGFHVYEGPGSQAPGTFWLELAYHLRRDCWGRGFATEAARACIDYGAGSLAATHIIALTAPENIASQHVLQKLGFRRQGEQGDALRFMYDGAAWPTRASSKRQSPR
jgi:ribosomal-protein-alanine N-acetyltransferase